MFITGRAAADEYTYEYAAGDHQSDSPFVKTGPGD